MAGPIGEAARKGDYDEVVRLSLVKVCDLLDATDSGRDGSALFIKILDGVEKIQKHDDAPKRKRNGKEVTRLEVISGRRSGRREAAEG